MPFMIGPSPIRRTTSYLEAGKIVFREAVKIFSLNFVSNDEEHNKGAREFLFWNLCQIQYKNPKVQCVVHRNLTPIPFIRIFFEDAKSLLIDLDSREREDIVEHLENFTAICKTQEEIQLIAKLSERKTAPSIFGFGCERHCICEVPGQIPCPRVVKLPNSWRGVKNIFNKKIRIPPCYMELGLEDGDDEE